MAGFFPVFFKEYWSIGVEATVSTFRLGLANSLGSIVIVLLAPILGAIADRGGAKKRFLLFFTAMGVVMTGGLYFVAQGDWVLAVVLYALATIGFSGGNVFYDALLVDVVGPRKVDYVSALGYAYGYLGGGLLFALNVWMTLAPATFGLAGPDAAVRLSFLTVAVWWAVFCVPLFVFVREPRAAERVGARAALTGGLRQLVGTLRKLRRLKVVALFLVAYWFYIDGVDTVVRMAVDYGMSLGFGYQDLILALLLTQFVAFPAAIAFGKIGEHWGAKRGIFIGIAVYIAAIVWAYHMQRPIEFYGLAVAIGLVQGGVQSLSRSFYSQIIPHNHAAEFFGFYNMLGKFAAVLGPVMVGAFGVLTGSIRHSILAVIVLFVIGALLLYMVDQEEGRRVARELERG
jgi:MFS transporter, UMF1 family